MHLMSCGIAIPVGNWQHNSQPRVVQSSGSAALTPPVVGVDVVIVQSPSLPSCDCELPAYVGNLPLNGGNMLRSKLFLLRHFVAWLPWLDVINLFHI